MCVVLPQGALLRRQECRVQAAIPLLGGILLAAVFIKTTFDTWDPDYGTGSSIFGIGSVFVLGIGLLIVGVVLMLVWRARSPEFFRGEVLQRDTPSLVVEE